jgi:hypothetical protein
VRLVIALLAACSVLGCQTPTTQRYAISADNLLAFTSIGATRVGTKTFVPPASFDANCRGLGPIKVADNLTHTQYIQKAFEDELKLAGAFAAANPRVIIGAEVRKLEFSSTKGFTGGYWQIDIALESSNGRRLVVSEHYEFQSGVVPTDACRNTAEAYSRAVQNWVGKAVKAPGFAELLR